MTPQHAPSSEMPVSTYRRALTVAGSDSGGGAGVQADLKTFSALGCYGMSVICAVTAQNTLGVTGIFPVPPEFVARQIDAVFDDIGADAVKIGMLDSPETVAAVADRLRAHGAARIVLDPVMVAKSGHKLLRDDAVEAVRERLLPLATVLTPNLPEAAILLGRGATPDGPVPFARDDMPEAGRSLLAMGPAAVLMKGGHLADDARADDCLVYKRPDGTVGERWFAHYRVATPNTHGTGCTLSSAIAAHLARGFDTQDAVERGIAYLADAIRAGAGQVLGHGHGPVHHFHALWQ